MTEIKDIRQNMVATGDPETGTVELRHGGRGMRVVLSEGQTVTLTRGDTVTEVTRKQGGFFIQREYAG